MHEPSKVYLWSCLRHTSQRLPAFLIPATLPGTANWNASDLRRWHRRKDPFQGAVRGRMLCPINMATIFLHNFRLLPFPAHIHLHPHRFTHMRTATSHMGRADEFQRRRIAQGNKSTHWRRRRSCWRAGQRAGRTLRRCRGP